MSDQAPVYRGSPKHKRRPGRGRKGSFCPEWTHTTQSATLGDDPRAQDWASTEAQRLLLESVEDPDGSGRRYATARGVAFVAQNTNDGTWHGYPEPWNKVPAELKDSWLAMNKVTVRELRRYAEFPRARLDWAMDTDDD